jgi:predicted esterase
MVARGVALAVLAAAFCLPACERKQTQPAPRSIIEPVAIPETNEEAVRVCPEALARVSGRLAELRAASPNALFTRHLDAIGELARIECDAALKPGGDPRACIRYLGDLLRNLYAPEADWPSARARRQSLALGFRSSADGSRQFYKLWLPANWNPTRAYPLIVYLHGRGGPEALRFFTRPTITPQGLAAATSRGELPLIAEPWARGNSEYRGPAEQDVLDTLADAGKTARVDPTRVYLAGHSMGGRGALTVGVHSADHWTALGICSARIPLKPDALLKYRDKLRGVAVIIWHGENDMAERARMIDAALRAAGIRPALRIIADQGHSLPGEHQRSVFEWLLRHSRTLGPSR